MMLEICIEMAMETGIYMMRSKCPWGKNLSA